MKMGTWTLESKSDPRWNCEGRGLVGMFSIPPDAKEKVEELREKLGPPPPDLYYSYMKD